MSFVPPPQPQRYRRRLAMSPEEIEEYLATERTCRLATVSSDGRPHVTPLWFVWWDGALWLYSLTRSRRFAELSERAQVSVVVDSGVDFLELKGVEIGGAAEVVGEVPRRDTPDDAVAEPERLTAAKYFGGTFVYDGRHAWVKVVPDRVVSWDHARLIG